MEEEVTKKAEEYIKKEVKDAFTDFIEDLESEETENIDLGNGQVLDSDGNIITLDQNKRDIKEK